MFHKSKRIIAAVMALTLMLMFCGCGIELEQHVSTLTINNKEIDLDIPSDWIYSSDGDMMFFAKSKEQLENDDWIMMLSANLISTVGDDLSALGIAQKIIVDGFSGKDVTTEKVNGDCVWVSINAAELSYFIVKDEDSGIYYYGRVYNAEVDEETGKAIADSIKIGE